MISSLYSLLYKTNNNILVYRFIKLFLNLFYPVYCKIKINKNKEFRNNVIISLTTFPARINSVWIIIETLLRQNYRPEKVILWLSKSQFESKDKLPTRLLKQQERGLEIRFCEGDLRSHKKYYYSMKEFPKHFIITVDDDTFYPENLLENLFEKYEECPNTICCNIGHELTLKDGKIAPYKEWNSRGKGCNDPSHYLVPICFAGVLYPPNCMDENIFNKEQIVELCFMADDLWLKAMATLNNVKAVKTTPKPITYVNLTTTESSSLNRVNVEENMNDVQLGNIIKQYPQLNKIWK